MADARRMTRPAPPRGTPSPVRAPGSVAEGVPPDGLPAGRQLAITWAIPDSPGGMTAALLHRSRSFVELGGAEVDVLTFDARPDHIAIAERLTRQGRLVPGVRLRNLYDDVRGDVRVAGPGTVETHEVDGGLRIEHRRADGSLALIDERHRSGRIRRVMTALDADERPLRTWRSAWSCYADWISDVAGDGPAFAIVDSKTAARFVAAVRRPELVTIHVVHNSHLAGAERPLGVIRASRRDALTHPEAFDAVVFLTERQRADADALLVGAGTFAVVPNATPEVRRPADPGAGPRRDPASIVVVAGLTSRKRIDHAIECVRVARSRGASVRLTVIGDGPERERLRDAADRAGLEDSVAFVGYRAHAADAFAEASLTLLTSTSEGAPLVLLEAMARGCVPVAYDVPYGPADVIEDGVTGFLARPGDVAALADAVVAFATLPEAERRRMREAARRAAASSDAASTVARWAEVQRSAQARHRGRFETSGGLPSPAPVVRRLRLRRPGARLRVSAHLDGLPDGASVLVRLEHRSGPVIRRSAVVARSGRVRLRLDADATAFLGGGRLRVGFVILNSSGAVDVPAGTRHPDTRSLAARLRDRIRRATRRSAGGSPGA
ncbi:glycosyltransferase [Agromyces sp. M3QZ16-3]|uniref:glycosyltransferase n=1 Tax=Agromyces sp. M3QZ16-3 TaxID=3447585 RepID=UPI003F69004E